MIYIINTVPFSIDMIYDSQKLLMYSKPINNCFLVNTIVLAPFLNYVLCALYFKKDNENYFKLFFNCYKHLNLLGILIAILITLASYMGGVIYIILALFLNPFVYSINTFWYSARLKN